MKYLAKKKLTQIYFPPPLLLLLLLDPGWIKIRIRDGFKKLRFGIRDKHPGFATLRHPFIDRKELGGGMT